MGQIRGFFRSNFSAFGTGAPNALKSDLKKPRICPIWGQSDPIWSQTYHPWGEETAGVGCQANAFLDTRAVTLYSQPRMT